MIQDIKLQQIMRNIIVSPWYVRSHDVLKTPTPVAKPFLKLINKKTVFSAFHPGNGNLSEKVSRNLYENLGLKISVINWNVGICPTFVVHFSESTL